MDVFDTVFPLSKSEMIDSEFTTSYEEKLILYLHENVFFDRGVFISSFVHVSTFEI